MFPIALLNQCLSCMDSKPLLMDVEVIFENVSWIKSITVRAVATLFFWKSPLRLERGWLLF